MLKRFGPALLVCLIAVAARAQETKPPAEAAKPPPPSPFTFALHGFVSVSGYYQDSNTAFSEGQQAIWATGKPANDASYAGFDVRQSRFNFSLKGPKVLGGATPTGVLELDFFQGFGGGNYGNVSLLNRMRLAYSELNWGNNRLAFGQLNDLVFAMAPVSLAHIAFPLGYGTGNIGWRRPGVFGFHNFGSGASKFEFAWEVGRSQWADNGLVGNNTVITTNAPTGVSLAEGSTLPAVEARLTLTSGTAYNLWVGGHWNRVDLNGVGTSGGDNLDVMAVNAGAKATFGPLSLAATGFVGQNTAPLIGNFAQFQGVPTIATPPATTPPPLATKHDISNWGAWGQVGYNLTKEFSAWGFLGYQSVDKNDARDASVTGYGAVSRVSNLTSDVMLQYRDGGYAFGAEWIHFVTESLTGATGTATNFVVGNQWIASANYFF